MALWTSGFSRPLFPAFQSLENVTWALESSTSIKEATNTNQNVTMQDVLNFLHEQIIWIECNDIKLACYKGPFCSITGVRGVRSKMETLPGKLLDHWSGQRPTGLLYTQMRDWRAKKIILWEYNERLCPSLGGENVRTHRRIGKVFFDISKATVYLHFD